jgi:hypothetical protein
MMDRFGTRLAFTIALALLTAGSAGFARASVAALQDLASSQLQSSATPALLGPINELGRNGWQCAPERAAQAVRGKAAELPPDDGPQ